MGEERGFLKLARQASDYRQVCERVGDFKDVYKQCPESQSQEQASRCMDCSTPFCHWACPVGNYIPEWNDYIFHSNWKQGFKLLDATNNLPEITGRVCPALCEYACVLGLNDESVTIRENELSIIEAGFKNGLIKPQHIENRTGKNVAVVGSGPAGLSCAAQLNRAGHNVTVFERDNQPGGILRYGIPDFKLEKHILDRRIDIWKEEGVVFKTGVDMGINYPSDKLLADFDAVCLAGGCRVPRDLKIEGRQLKGVYFAMEYLTQSNKRVSGEKITEKDLIDAKDKKVVVIGGGDSGADCVGTAHRQRASCVVQIEVLPQPAECRTPAQPWPNYPLILKVSSSHEEGGERHWQVLTKSFIGEKNHLKKLSCVKVEFLPAADNACPVMREIPQSEFEISADLVILAIGFLHPEKSGLLNDLDLEFDTRGNIATDKNYMTSLKNVFSAGDMRRGQSLVVWAIAEGRRCAYFMDKYLMGRSNLPVI
ncbi:MAG: glutamate synthase subunit beta [Candidatus Omnitrophica bacterium]|nr:glutamate synthase subunit beta [Candidatus Omnitrophota bacterium]MBU1924022.1 glutamate synthase subunit beta [Candidatus Omnitrophota bacterium]